MPDLVARVLAVYRREVGDPPFPLIDQLLEGEGLTDLAHRIEIDAEARQIIGRPGDPQRWLGALASAPERDAAIDAIVAASLGDVMDDTAFMDRARSIARHGADFAASVARFRFVRALLRHAEPPLGDATSDDGALPSAPCDFGPPISGHAHRFHLLRRLGAGANGTVFEAVDHRYSDGEYRHIVVVKILPPAIADRADGELLRGGRVLHPSVVRWLDSGIDPSGFGFVVSELVPGRTLEDEGVLEALGWRGAMNAMRQIARAIEATHAVGILHLDLKPANILVEKDGQARLCDFGAARTVSSAEAIDESTPFFAAPEVLKGCPAGVAADIYALGAVLRWCTDELESIGTAPMDRHDAERLEQIWSRAMDPSPERRHAAARELADDLDAWIDRRPLPRETPALAESLRLSIRRDPITWGLGVATVAAVVLLGWSWISGRIQQSNRRADQMAQEARRLRAQAGLSLYVDRLGTLASANGLTAAPQVLAMQWLVGPRGVRDQQLEAQTLTAQRNAWDSVVREATETGSRDRLEPKLAALSLAASDLEMLTPDRAAALMEEDLPWWRARLDKDDPTLLAAEAIAMLATFNSDPAAARQERSAWRERLQRHRAAVGVRDPKLARLIDIAITRLDTSSPR